MSKLIELSGRKFGRLVVMERIGNKNRKPVWLCTCACGKRCEVRGEDLRKGHVRSCGCLRSNISKSRGHDLTGMIFGRWTVVQQLPNKGKRRNWLCVCACGNQGEVTSDNLKWGRSLSCGCLRAEISGKLTLVHGHARRKEQSKEYTAWYNAKVRCHYPRAINFHAYGGRGIQMCDEWRGDFTVFLRDMGPCPEGRSLDRIDVNGNYEPGNCRWATDAEQARNRRNNHYIEFRGQNLVLTDWAARLGITPQQLDKKLKQGRTLDDLFAVAAESLRVA